MNDRNDILLHDILKEIKKTLDNKFECVVPVTPKDDLFVDYDKTRTDNFLNNLKDFIDDSDSALKEKNQLKSSRLWQKHLGTRFPDGENKDEEFLGGTKVIEEAKKSNPWGN